MVIGPRSFVVLAATLAVGSGPWQGSAGQAASRDRPWSYEPVRVPEIPTPEDTRWPLQPIDRFVLARLESAGLRPAEPAAPSALVRRVSFDLTGLPPSPETIAGFMAEGAYERLVDRLLASPAFGERFGRHWLDVARFAESSGGGRSLMFENAWRFRDYVIDSYNADRPFDVFVSEQLAGDLLPFENDAQRNRQLVASGFLELGAINYEQQDKELLRMEVIDEQIDTVGRAFLAQTLGCARCHDHKFDPIPTRDYYALAGIFGSTQVLTPGNVSGYVEQAFAGERTRMRRAYDKRIRAIRAELAALRKNAGKRTGHLDPAKLPGIVIDDDGAQLVGDWKPSTSVAGYLGSGYIHDENALKGEKSVVFTPEIATAGNYEVRLAYTPGANRATNVPVEVRSAEGTKLVRVNQRVAPDILGSFVSLGQYRFEAGTDHAVSISTTGTDGHVIVDGLQLVAAGSAPATPSKTASARIRRLTAELKKLEKTPPAKVQKAMAVRDAEKPEDGHIHVRGLVRAKGERVPRGFLSACGGADPEIPEGQSGRLQLAAWLTDPKHPLTARVYVNRVWHWLFGKGLVRTTDNFGTMGETPSHPELLDWLAHWFVTNGWSTKKLVRMLVLSRTYRMAVAESPAGDPENRWLSHSSRRRLDAESIRDAILVVSGRLDPKLGGPTIRALAQYDYGYRFESRRRSVYVPRFRSNRLELFDVFDAADPNVVTGKRSVSRVSPQALYLLNSPWVIAQSRHAAERLLARGPATAESRLERAYLLVIGRKPTAGERKLALGYLAKLDSDAPEAWSRLFHTLFACLDFRYLD